MLLISNVALSQSAFIRLSADGLRGKEIQVFENKGIVHNTMHVSNFTFNSQGKISIPLVSKNWPVVRVISYGDANLEITLTENDTIEIGWEIEKKEFKILHNTQLNWKVNAINDVVNRLIIDFTMKGPKRLNPSRMLKAADSLRTVSSAERDKYLATYQWFAAGDLEMISGRFSQEALIKSVFLESVIEPLHPAWRNTFHLIYENSLINNVAHGNTDELKSKLSQNRWSILYDWISADSSLCDSMLCKWVTLKNCYDLSFQPGYNLNELYKLVDDGNTYYTYDSTMLSEMKSILSYWYPRIKGKQFPDIEFNSLNASKLIHLSDFKGMPIYAGFLPDMSTSSMLIISQFKALQTKYGKEIRFLLFLPTKSSNISALLKQYPTLEFADNERVEDKISEYFGRNDQPAFFMVNRKGETYQFPAEGPETDVENAFLGLIKE